MQSTGNLRLSEVAEALSAQTARMLGTRAFVVDSEHRVVAASHAGWRGRFVRGDSRDKELEIPVQLGGEHGWVVISRLPDGSSVPGHLASSLISLLLDHAAMAGNLTRGVELKNKIIHDLLHGPGEDEEHLVRQATLLGMDLNPPRAVILIDASRVLGSPQEQTHDQLTDKAQQIIDGVVAFFQLPNDTICAHIGDGEIAVLKASDSRNLQHWANDEDVAIASSWANLQALKRAGRGLLSRLQADTGKPLSIGLGRYHRGPGGLARSYADARAALRLGVRLRSKHRIHSLDQLGVAAFVGVADERTKIELARHLLSPLDADRELLGTLDVYFREDCHHKAAAERLGVHRNTLNYRLEKVSMLTGLDPRRFDDAVQIRLALVLRALERENRREELAGA